MKQYISPFFSDYAQLAVSEGHSYVFTFPMCFYEIIPGLRIKVDDIVDSLSSYMQSYVIYAIMKGVDSALGLNTGRGPPHFQYPEKDTNMVIRLERTSSSSNDYAIYINGRFNRVTKGFKSARPEDAIRAARAEVINSNYRSAPGGYEFPVVLTVFRESEQELGAVFAEAMRNPEVAIANTLKNRGTTLAKSQGIKQYKISPSEVIDVSASNGQCFVISFPKILFMKTAEVYIGFGSADSDLASHTMTLSRSLSEAQTIVYPGDLVLTNRGLLEEDMNVVVRVERNATFPASFTTYVNGQFASNAEAHQGSGGHVSHVLLKRTTPDSTYTFTFVAFLTVFDNSERRKAAGFAEAIRNPHSGYFAPNNWVSEDKEKSVKGREKAVENKEKALKKKEIALKDKEKELGKAKVSDARGKKITQTENGLKGGGDGSDQSSARSNVLPSDMEMIQESTATAWPRAVKRVLGSEDSDVKQRHAALMSEWVLARGDDHLSSAAYDYLVYSHGVAWPKAVLETTSYAKLASIREKHQEIMEALGF